MADPALWRGNGIEAALSVSQTYTSSHHHESLSMTKDVVANWIQAFNGRDLDGMLKAMTPDVSFHPVRVPGIGRAYRGHDGIVRWYEELVRLDVPYRIATNALMVTADSTVLAVGELKLEDEHGVAPFWGVHRIDKGLITAARQYVSDTDALPSLSA